MSDVRAAGRAGATVQFEAGFSGLARSADGLRPAYLTFSLTRTTVTDLAFLGKYRYLQKLELSKNMIRDLSHLSGKEDLISINVAGNCLTQLLDIPAPQPRNLRDADFRMNQIADFVIVKGSLRAFSNLHTLSLDNNIIHTTRGLQALTSLRKLGLSNNRLGSCDGLEALSALVHLDISRNAVSSLAPLAALQRLRVLLATDNRVTTLHGIGACRSLNKLDVSNNRIAHLQQVYDAARCPLLGSLTLSGNPALGALDYRLHIVYFLPQVTLLDNLLVDEKEKVHAQNLHGADAAALQAIRLKHFPRGELPDGGGAMPPMAAGLLACPGGDVPPSGSGPEDFAAVDAFVDAVPAKVLFSGALMFADQVTKKFQTQLEIARAAFRWTVRNVTFPRDGSWGQSVTAPLFPHAPGLEEALLYGATGTWSERAAQLFNTLAKACRLESVLVPGYWRNESLWPGAALLGHNHCWNAVKVNGAWRLVDCAAVARDGGHGTFYTDPEHFAAAYQPLSAPWSLLRAYGCTADFWRRPWLAPRFLSAGCRLLSPDLHAVEKLSPPMECTFLQAPQLRLAVAHGYRVEHRLLSKDLQPLYPPDRAGWQPKPADWTSCTGAPIFQDQVAGPEGAHEVPTISGPVAAREHRCCVALPRPGRYVHEVFLVKDLPQPMRLDLRDGPRMALSLQEKHPVLRVMYELPKAVPNTEQGCPVEYAATPQRELPAASPEWLHRGAQLLQPCATAQLEADRPQRFALRIPGAAAAAVVPADGATRHASGPESLRGSTRSLGGARAHLDWSAATRLELDDDSGVLSAEVLLPRRRSVDVVAQLEEGGPWVPMLRFRVRPEGQQLRERPDLVFVPPEPAANDPGMHLVREIMKGVDRNGDGKLSRMEYLTKIRKDRKYADFLKMQPRVRAADGTLDKFIEQFMDINISRTGYITQNELAYYTGCSPASRPSDVAGAAAQSYESRQLCVDIGEQ